MAIMQGQIVAGRVQSASDCGTDAFGGAGDQCDRTRVACGVHAAIAADLRRKYQHADNMPIDLPEPGPDERRHSERLAAVIRAEIAAAGGAMDFARFMELALYAPG